MPFCSVAGQSRQAIQATLAGVDDTAYYPYFSEQGSVKVSFIKGRDSPKQ